MSHSHSLIHSPSHSLSSLLISLTVLSALPFPKKPNEATPLSLSLFVLLLQHPTAAPTIAPPLAAVQRQRSTTELRLRQAASPSSDKLSSSSATPLRLRRTTLPKLQPRRRRAPEPQNLLPQSPLFSSASLPALVAARRRPGPSPPPSISNSTAKHHSSAQRRSPPSLSPELDPRHLHQHHPPSSSPRHSPKSTTITPLLLAAPSRCCPTSSASPSLSRPASAPSSAQPLSPQSRTICSGIAVSSLGPLASLARSLLPLSYLGDGQPQFGIVQEPEDSQ
uniref:Phytocyanin-related n=1 Tax=Asparagus officinalis TaxID=4686 RepID=Q2XNZ1_ASPOF|nr:phytocyanin-related [Asparagus officinalis]